MTLLRPVPARTTGRGRSSGATGSSGSAGSARSARRHGHIDALDGVRAVALLLVLLFHFGVPGWHGGFLGVDLFFVLSGFLITSLLLTEAQAHGRIDLARFWARRVLRLLPASLLVIGAVLTWAVVAAPPLLRGSAAGDALWALLYAANWRFIASSGYFADDGTTSPLQHMWSLAVEEQFYLAWPLLLTLVVGGARRRFAARRAAVLAAGLAAASVVVLALAYQPGAPDRAYMGTDARAFEPLLGAMAAALLRLEPVRAWVDRRARRLTWGGLAVVVAGVALLGAPDGPRPGYFAGGALVVALGGAALITAASVADPRRGLTGALGRRPLVYLGRISYGVYLWHWPLRVWLIGDRDFDPVRAGLVAGLSIAVAALSYHLVEEPIRTGRPVRWRSRTVFAVAAAGVTACLGATALTSQVGRPTPATVEAQQARPAPPEAPGPDDAPGDEPQPVHVDTYLVVGDSVMRRLAPQLSQAAADRGLTLLSAARGGCPVLTVEPTPKMQAVEECVEPVRSAQSEQLEQRPGTIVWWSRWELADRVDDDGRELVAGTPQFWRAQRDELRATVDRLTAGGARLVVVEIDRPGVGINSLCSSDCTAWQRLLRERPELRATWNETLREVAAADPRVSTITMDDVYCRDDASPCDDRLPIGEPSSGDAPLARPDGQHFSDEALPTVADALLDRVAAAR